MIHEQIGHGGEKHTTTESAEGVADQTEIDSIGGVLGCAHQTSQESEQRDGRSAVQQQRDMNAGARLVRALLYEQPLPLCGFNNYFLHAAASHFDSVARLVTIFWPIIGIVDFVTLVVFCAECTV